MPLRITRNTEVEEAPSQDHEELFTKYLAAKTAADQATSYLKAVEQDLIAEMESKQQKTASLTKDGVRRTATYVRTERETIDEAALIEAIGKREYNKYTDRKINMQRLADAIDDPNNPLGAEQVLPHVRVVQNKPYLRYTEANASDE